MKNPTLAEQQALRARAHGLNPVVMISEKGLSETVLAEIDRSLKVHELIKIRVFGDDRETRATILATVCQELQAVAVQHIGKILVIYRQNPEPAQEAARKPAPAMAPRTGKAAKPIPRALAKGAAAKRRPAARASANIPSPASKGRRRRP